MNIIASDFLNIFYQMVLTNEMSNAKSAMNICCKSPITLQIIHVMHGSTTKGADFLILVCVFRTQQDVIWSRHGTLEDVQ